MQCRAAEVVKSSKVGTTLSCREESVDKKVSNQQRDPHVLVTKEQFSRVQARLLECQKGVTSAVGAGGRGDRAEKNTRDCGVLKDIEILA